MADRCTSCDQRTGLPVLCAACRAALRDPSPETCPWPPEEPRVVVVARPVRWRVPVPYVPDVTEDDYEDAR